MAKTIHQIGRELHEELLAFPGGVLRLTYAEYRRRFGIPRRDIKALNRVRLILSGDCAVLVNPEVDGQTIRGKEHAWSSFKDDSTWIICRLRGAMPANTPPAREMVADAGLWVTDDNAMQVIAAQGNHPHPLYEHQKAAIEQMKEKMVAGFAGVLVVPTGGGKTRTAVHFLLSEVLDKGGEVLWLAHRHSLIDQACNAFCQSAYRGDVLHAKERFTCRKVSGRHAQPVELTHEDDVVIGSVFSLGRSNGTKFLRDKWLSDERRICLVVDEAHHAPAPTYRRVIDEVRNHRPETCVLGLTATPYRTAKSEQGLMKKMFPGDIIHTVDLQELVIQGILAEPHFEDVATKVNFQLDEGALATLIRSGGDFGKLGEGISATIGTNKERNRLIVDHYVNNRKRYGRTIIFALNIANAIALTALLKQRGIAAGYVVSSIHDADHNVKIDAELNEKTIDDFRKGSLDVVANVNILTEGFDDPKVQTVFLARPTLSTIMMMQMVGRALRGPRANGTQTANIVSFIDDWADKIQWKSPRELMAREEATFAESPDARRKAVLKLISIRLIEEYATFLDSELGGNVFGNLEFTERIPIGVYIVSVFEATSEVSTTNGDSSALDQSADILVFKHAKDAFDKLLSHVQAVAIPSPSSAKFEQFVDRMMQHYFAEIAGLPFSPNREEIRLILDHIAKYGTAPEFLGFDQREHFNIDKIAKDIYEQDMGDKAKVLHLKELWDKSQTGWQTFFGGDFPCFVKTVQDVVNRLAIDVFREDSDPKSVLGRKSVEDCSMAELFEKHPERWKQIREAVYSAAYDTRTKKYRCAATGWQSVNRNEFQIDHIKPRSAGGKTVPENLRLLRRRENGIKGQKWEEAGD